MMPHQPVAPSSDSIRPSSGSGEAVEPAVAANHPTGYIPLMEETLTVGKRVVQTGQVRLVKTVHQAEQMVQIPLMTDQIRVERVLINELVDEPPATRQEGDTIIYPVLKEEYVLIKRLRLMEAIRVTTRQIQTLETQTVRLRREEMVVERTAVDNTHERSDSADESSLIDQSIL
ncbi:YsnF/AvaK domain-containing protein [Spirosoma endophyticum]|uniref:Conserved domain-containing protein n=1 Tax=Spirosoma endophyticum TaxID=662367 RepID=A0A1I2G4V9_9BACT|nr:YsnF/AvaK domain-containing protein [Spirosoma endophyticum]SFF12754.1 conserved domain-containing protein [Spirosoma endophyticum]